MIGGRFGLRRYAGERQEGSVLVEFAVAVAFALTLLFGVIEFGQAVFTYDLVSNAARIGSRYAIVHGAACTLATCPVDVAHIQTYVQGESPGVTASKLTVSTTWAADPGAGCPVNNSNLITKYEHPGCLVTVTASYPFSLVFSYKITMSSTSQMVISQ